MRWIVLALTSVCAAVSSAAAQDTLVVQRLAGHDTNGQDWFGYSVDLREANGEVLALVGAPRASGLTEGGGYVFRLDGATGLFVEAAKLVVFNANAFQGEDVALLPPDSSSRWLAVVGGGNPARLWRRLGGPGTLWQHVAVVRPPGNTYEYGGRAVGVARDGAGAEYVALSERDSLFVFRRAPGAPDDASGWLLDGGLTVVPSPGLSLEQGMLAMWAGLDGAVRLAFPVVTNPRAVVLFARDPGTGTWAEETRLFGSSLLPGHRFGLTAVTGGHGWGLGDVVVVGAPYWVEPYDQPGQAYVFRRNPSTGTWNEEAVLEPDSHNGFGLGVAIDRSVLAIGGLNRAWVSVRDDAGAWPEAERVDIFGIAVQRSRMALAGPYLAFGDFLDDALGFQAGAAWVLTLPGALTPADPAPAPPALTLSISPQPARGQVQVRYTLPAHAPARLALHDVLGRVVWRHEAPAGAAGVMLPAGDFAAGVYVLRLESGGQAVALNVVVAR